MIELLDLNWLSDRRNLCVVVKMCADVEGALARIESDVSFLFKILPQKQIAILWNHNLRLT